MALPQVPGVGDLAPVGVQGGSGSRGATPLGFKWRGEEKERQERVGEIVYLQATSVCMSE